MKRKNISRIVLSGLLVFSFACAGAQPRIEVEKNSAQPGKHVAFKGSAKRLLGTPIAVGEKLPPATLVDSRSMAEADLSEMAGGVLFLSVVPSVDTEVCEAQTHYLGEEGDELPAEVKRITVSRDLPFAHRRFAEEADLEDIAYFSDYKDAEFGKSTGLLVEDLMLLARSVILVDEKGIVRYIQVVPEITHLPDMEAAFEKARELAGE